MALIESVARVERLAVSFKMPKDVYEQLRAYAKYIDSPQEHVVTEALLIVFRKDKEFQEWLATPAGQAARTMRAAPASNGRRAQPNTGNHDTRTE